VDNFLIYLIETTMRSGFVKLSDEDE